MLLWSWLLRSWVQYEIDTCDQPPCSVLQKSMWSLTRNSSTSLWPTISRPTTCLRWRSWPRALRSSWAVIGWPSFSPGTFALQTTRFAKRFFQLVPYACVKVTCSCLTFLFVTAWVFRMWKAVTQPCAGRAFADAAGDVSLPAAERGRAGAGSRRFCFHVSGGSEQHERGLGVRDLAGFGPVGSVARELRQSGRWVRHVGLPWVSSLPFFIFITWQVSCGYFKCRHFPTWRRCTIPFSSELDVSGIWYPLYIQSIVQILRSSWCK